jgi:hypothetical protein
MPFLNTSHTVRKPVEFPTPIHWNLIGSRVSSAPPLLSPSSILPPPVIAVLFPQGKIWNTLQNCFYFLFHFLFSFLGVFKKL